MPVILYHTKTSPFSRAVLLFMRYLNIDVEVKILDFQKGEHMTEEFLQINPQHCVPTLDDNGFILWESRAILSYLIETRAPHLIPSSPKEKAIINQRLYHEMGTLMKKIGEILVRVYDEF
jgi:glutathione S-transferase